MTMEGGMLPRGRKLVARSMQSAAIIYDMLGEGAQAEVFRASIGDSWYAVKWYRPEYRGADPRLWDRLKIAIDAGSPAEDNFCGPSISCLFPRSLGLRRDTMPHQSRPNLSAWSTCCGASASRHSRRSRSSVSTWPTAS